MRVKIFLLKIIAGWNPFFFFQKHRFHFLHFPNSTDFSQNQPAANTLNTGSPRTLASDHRDYLCEDITKREKEK